MGKILLPELGDGITKATVACWLVNLHDKVEKGDDIVEVVTDKASFCLPAEAAGRLTEIVVGEGKEVPVGGTLGYIATD